MTSPTSEGVWGRFDRLLKAMSAGEPHKANARPMELDWARGLQHDARRLGRVFNFKQVGGRSASKGGHSLDGATYFNRPTVREAA